MNKQIGNGLISDLATLSFPLGLSIISKLDNEKKEEKDHKGGFLSDNMIIETGLAVIPFSLLSLADLYSKDKENDK